MNFQNTNPPTITLVPINTLTSSPVNQRSFPKKNGKLQELAESIKSQGLLHPLVVRFLETGNKLEIVAGERRFRACKLLNMKSIPSIVRKLSDSEAYEITATENLQREDLTPLEEAESVRVLLEGGREPKDVADRLGKSAKWVIRRSKLSDLAPCWRKAITNPDNAFSKWGAMHLELIARYESSKQASLLKHFNEGYVYNLAMLSVSDLEKSLQENVQTLSSAPWKLSDETVLPSAGACLSCTCRSSCAPDLFDVPVTKKGGTKDYCLDDQCWGKKLIAHNTQRISALKEKHSDLILISNNGPRTLPKDHPWGGKTHHEYDFKSSNKKDKKAVPAFIIDGTGAGHVKYVAPWTTASSMSGCHKSLTSGAPKSLAERRTALEKRRTILFITKIIQLLSNEQPEQPGKEKKTDRVLNAKPLDKTWTVPGQTLKSQEVFALVASFGAADKEPGEWTSKPWKIFDEVKAFNEKRICLVALRGVCIKIIGELHGITNMNKPDKKFAENVCAALYLNKSLLWKMVLEEIPDPKIWATLNADGTKKENKPSKK